MSQDRERHDEVVQLVVTAFHVLRFQFKRQFLHRMAFGILLLTDNSVDGFSQSCEVAFAVALCEFLQRIDVGHLTIVVAPGNCLLAHVVGPDTYLTGLDDQGQATVQLIVGFGDALVLQPVYQRIGNGSHQQDQGPNNQIPYPGGDLLFRLLRIEPFVLYGSDLLIGIEIGIGLVEQIQQVLVVGHELIFTMRHVHGGQFEVIQMIAVDEPFQCGCVTDDLSLFLDTDLLDGLFQVTTGNGIVAPAVVEHQVMAQAGVADDHFQTVFAQVAEVTDLYLFLFRGGDTLGEEGDGMPTIAGVLIVEAGCQTECEVGLACFQILKDFLLRLETDDIGNIQLLHQSLDEVDVKSFRVAFVVHIGVGPQVAGVFINQGTVSCIEFGVFRLYRRMGDG